jgi:hypothetical protein
MQVAEWSEIRSLLGDLLQLAFSVGVAWYMITKNTTVLDELRKEVTLLRVALEEARREVTHQGNGIRQEMRGMSDAMNDRRPR